MQIKPITPSEVNKLLVMPNVVIATMNRLISERWNGKSAYVSLRDFQTSVKKELGPDEHPKEWWWDIEPIYESAGWNVKYDSPGYNESGEANFVFTKKS